MKLPAPLAEHPFLQEFYGGVEWTVRGIYADQVGWFDGNPTRLFPLPEKDRATRLVALIGGADRVLERGQAALANGDFTWAAELADYVLVNDTMNAGARRIKARALTGAGRAPDQRHRAKLLSDLSDLPLEGPSASVNFGTGQPAQPR